MVTIWIRLLASAVNWAAFGWSVAEVADKVEATGNAGYHLWLAATASGLTAALMLVLTAVALSDEL